MSKYRVLQMTNQSIGAVTLDEFMPLGTITRRIQENCCGGSTFNITTSNADTVYLNEVGNYDITYSASLVADAAGIVSVALVVNGVEVYEVLSTAAEVGDVVNVTLPYQVRVCPNCASSPNNCPATVQVRLTGAAISSARSNLLIERVY